uniref:Uncharacterized protein n=1 Tax=Ignisphaera aggregans TaxID=334771 RepID=A0A7C5Z0N1_9CREN
MKRYTTIVAMLVISIVVAAVNAAAFAYRWMQVTVNVAGSEEARGVACVGFYSSSAQSGIPLPNAGTNYQATTYGTNEISVTPGLAICTWSSYSLYESITVVAPLTVGSWYIKDLYGFGYNATDGSTPVYVWIKVENAADESGIVEAKLILYNAETGGYVGEIDLKTTGLKTMTPITLNPGDALQLDLRIKASTTATASFEVGFYVSQQSSEEPR